MAILFVTVFVVEDDTAVDTTAVPVALGNVTVVSVAAAAAERVTDPPPVPLIDTGILQSPHQTMFHALPEETVTTIPLATVTGPNVPAFLPTGIV